MKRGLLFAWLTLLVQAIASGQTVDAVEREPLTIAVISDLNGSYGSVNYSGRVPRAIESIVELAPDLVISTGDMIAGQDLSSPPGTKELKAMWSAFHDHVTIPLARAGIPLAVTPGNHDASEYSAFVLERQEYSAQWLDHRPDLEWTDATNYPFSYAFTMEETLFVSLDATTVGSPSSEQLDWLSDLLDGSPATLKIVFSHLPVWPFAEGRETEVVDGEELRRVFEDQEVAIHLSGHHHAFYPGISRGVTYVSQGSLGAGPRRLVGTPRVSPHSYTVIEVDKGGIEVYALLAPDFRERQSIDSLPPQIKAPGGLELGRRPE